MRTLVVEDDTVAALYLRRSLERLGHEVAVATNGAAALTMLDAEGYRVVISDWMMPEMDGLDLCRIIRSRSEGPYVYFIMQTAKGNSESREEAMRIGCDDFFVKPIDIGDIVSRLVIADRMLQMKDELAANSRRISELSGLLEQHGTRLADLLIELGILTPDRIRQAREECANTRQSFVEVFLAKGWVDESVLSTLCHGGIVASNGTH